MYLCPGLGPKDEGAICKGVASSNPTQRTGAHYEEEEDERQLQWLLDGVASAKDRVTVVRYPDISGHHVSGSLKESGELKPLVQREILAAAAVAVPQPGAEAT